MYRYLEKVSVEDEEMVEYQRGQLIRSEAATILDAFISTTSAEVSGSSHYVSACMWKQICWAETLPAISIVPFIAHIETRTSDYEHISQIYAQKV